MKLIRKLGTRKNKKGVLQSWGIFECLFCLQKIERRLNCGKRDKSCGCVQYKLSAESNTGKKRTEAQIKKLSDSHKGLSVGQKSPMYGKKQTEETKQKIREKRELQVSPMKGRKHSKESRQKIAKAFTLENHWNWQGGKSFEEYSQEFYDIRYFILKRDNHICQNQNCEHKTNNLDCHHIDYNKQNNNPNNLITLCDSCHAKTNYNRQYWINYYNEIIGIFYVT